MGTIKTGGRVMAAVALTLMMGCSDDGSGSPDATQLVDQALLPDQGTIVPDLPSLPDLPDLGNASCDFEWQNAISPQQKVSTGAVSTTDLGGGIKETTIDASAGGVSNEIHNPFVYISLTDGSKVAIDDFAARTDSSWDLALRRTTLRVNGGDSGPGQGAVAVIVGSTLDQVTAVPDASKFLTDDFLDDNCVVQTNAAGYLVTAFGGTLGRWYDFDTTSMKILPNPDAYVVKTASGSYVKLEITSYYDASNEGGHFTIKWATLQ